jgi:glycosyltransferase involved in cell wall biosynthesis
MPGSRIKICHIIHLDGSGGGPQTVINHLDYFTVRHPEEFEISVIHGGAGAIAAACDRLGLVHCQLPIDRRDQLPLGFFKLASTLRRLGPDVVVLHGQWAAPIGALASRLAGCGKVIYVAQWPAFYTDWDLFRVVRNYIAEKIPCRLASRVVSISKGNHYQFLIRQMVPNGNLRLIPNPMDMNRVPSLDARQAIRREHHWSESQCHVVSVGRLADQKRIDWLLQSWKLVRANTAKAVLWIIGSGPEEMKLKRLAAELGLGNSCIFLGPRPNGINYVAASDIVAMTTLYEGHANVPLEAMACGKPIVANEVDGVRTSMVDGRQGFLVPPGDIRTFAARLLRLIRNAELRRRMGMEGLKRVRLFALPLTMEKHRALLYELVREK